VLEAIESALPDYSLIESAKILRNYGNMSSPSVLFALEEYLKNEEVENDLWLTAFGAGFSCHSCSIRQL
jgi:alkylresorcinol/alkylpyrone synthase